MVFYFGRISPKWHKSEYSESKVLSHDSTVQITSIHCLQSFIRIKWKRLTDWKFIVIYKKVLIRWTSNEQLVSSVELSLKCRKKPCLRKYLRLKNHIIRAVTNWKGNNSCSFSSAGNYRSLPMKANVVPIPYSAVSIN